MIRRNTAGQVIYLPQLTTTDGTPITSSATLTVAKDGSEGTSAGTLDHSANGVWKYTPTQAETDAAIVAIILTGTNAIPVVLNLVTTAADTSAVALGANTVAPLDATATQAAAAAAITAAALATAQNVTDAETTILAAIDDIDCSGGGLTGDYTLTITVTDAETNDPIENAIVTLSRTGERGAASTDASGIAVVGLDAATWTWVVRAAGYGIKTGTLVIADDDTLIVELDSIVLPVTTEDNQVTAFYVCIDEEGNPESGVGVVLSAEEAIDAVDGIALSRSVRSAMSDANGYAVFPGVTVGYSYVLTIANRRQYTLQIPATAQNPLPLRSIVR